MPTPAPSLPALTPDGALADVLLHFSVIAGDESGDSLLELRARRRGGQMRQRFVEVSRRRELAALALALAPHADVYVGCAPRLERFGGKRAIERVWTLWADCDGHAAVERLRSFAPAPLLVVRSGSGLNCHAYWPLREPLTAPEAERANRRLAHALGADLAATDAARILRAPGTWNHKSAPAAAVTLELVHAHVRFEVDEVVGSLSDPPREAPAEPQWPRPLPAGPDGLLKVSPDVYVPALTGRPLRRDRKLLCPLHEERSPSLHVYPLPEQGWYCFGCRRGGSIYDLAAALWRLQPRGQSFLELRRRLCELLLAGA